MLDGQFGRVSIARSNLFYQIPAVSKSLFMARVPATRTFLQEEAFYGLLVELKVVVEDLHVV